MTDPTKSPGEIQSAAKNLGDKTQKLNNTLKYTDGDMDLAKKLISGDFQDVYIIKGKVRSDISREFGLFLILLSKVTLKVKNIFCIMSVSPYIYDTKISLSWKEFQKEIMQLRNDKDFEGNTTIRVENHLNQTLATAEVAKIIHLLDHKEHQKVSSEIHKYFVNELKMSKSLIQVDEEITNSLIVEEFGIVDKNAHVGAETPPKDKEELPPNIVRLAGEAIIGSSVLSPTKGKKLVSLQVGDKIRVHITDTSKRGRNIIKILMAETEEGALKPVSARIRFIQKLKDGNWIILADLGQDTLIRMEEEADNVRIAVVEAKKPEEKRAEKSKLSQGFVIGLIIGGIVILISIFIFLYL